MAKHKAKYADVRMTISVELRFSEEIDLPEIRYLNAHVQTPQLVRPWTPAEVACDSQLNGDEWWEGGAAIIEPQNATNGYRLVDLAKQKSEVYANQVKAIFYDR